MQDNNKWIRRIIIILGICILIVMSATMGGRNKITLLESYIGNVLVPIYRGFTSVGNVISQRVNPILNVWNIKEENEKLHIENDKLKKEIMELTLDKKMYLELKKLKSALHYVDRQHTQNYVSASVIAKDTGNWYNMFVIDVGTENNIYKNSTVINSDGLIGIVYESGEKWAKVVTIIDNNSKVGFEMKRFENRVDGIITGSVENQVQGQLFDPKAKVEVGEEIITSGVGIFPKGIPIGVISEVVDDKNSLLINIIVEPSVNFKQIDKVMVIPARQDG